ncbi:hypothetical protein [Saccharopolyspora shandongensis]|uniref:hypothetical protein n=1 Tax=Saccharopolyspora shandongensis TaxID=418495 RepID=UPI0033EAE5C4
MSIVEISYTLRAKNGGIEYESVRAAQVPRIGELVTVGQQDSYEIVDVLWAIGNGEQRVMVTACERDWHEHIEDILDRWRGTGLNPDDAQHLVELMELIDWRSDAQDEDEDEADSAIPDKLNSTLDTERGIMLANALIDWDIIREGGPKNGGDALFRLSVVYVLPVFEGAPVEMDQALGELLSSASHPMCESPGTVEGLGRRWREELCATAWRLVLAHHRRERER